MTGLRHLWAIGYDDMDWAVLKTNVELKRAKLIQSTLAAAATGITGSNGDPIETEE
jgi:hypothetical protein